MTAELHALGAALGTALGRPVERTPRGRVAGGSIHAAYRWHSGAGPLFVKVAARVDAARFAAEADGLAALAAAHAVRVPAVLAHGAAGSLAFLALEWLEFVTPTRAAERALGEQLAAQHRVTASRFGFGADNFIGATPQPNGWSDDWPEFFAARRLRHQLALAAANGHGGPLTARGARLVEVVGAFYGAYRPRPSLLHGDLWSGNRGALADGTPVLFDPAPYYGDREADLAMTRLFGGFGASFYAAYDATWPPDPGARARVGLHNLYHVLNHLNLFGAGYAGEALALIDGLLAAAGG